MMDNPFPYSENNKRYHTWSHHLKQVFGCKVGKAALDGGFTCPNRDGTRGTGGCSYCSGRGSGDFSPPAGEEISRQVASQLVMLRGKWPGAKALAYFQAHTGTYAPLERLRELYEAALAQPDVVGLCVATRPDTLPEEVVEYLGELSRRTWLVVELGLQTVHDGTAERINRCHSYREFLEGYQRLNRAGVRVCVHLMNYLPGETEEMMLETVRQVGALEPHSVKLHMLYVLEGTGMGDLYRQGGVALPDRDTYVDLVCRQLELLPPGIVVQRLTGDPPGELLLAPRWTLDKRGTLNGIDRELARRGTWQGRLAE